MTTTITVPYRCDMLVDQGRSIGSDPVGYKCYSPAEWEAQDYLFCDSCRRMLATEPHRLTFPPAGFHGPAYQERAAKWALKSFATKHKAD